MTVHVFHGPSVTADEVTGILPDARRYPPVQHGDLLALDCRAGDVVLIIDGVFHATAPVRHKEILLLLAEGITVAGAASMGALRAAELHPYGMHGIGRVFEMYRDGAIDGDDEVAVLHTPDDARPLSVALVDIRDGLEGAVRAGSLDPAGANRLLRLARSIPYMRRSQGALRKAAENETDLPAAAFAWWTRPDGPLSSGATGLKHADALTALAVVAQGNLQPPDTGAWAEGAWYTPQLQDWVGQFRPQNSETGRVPFLAELQHQQLYDPGFPTRWRAFVLAQIAGDSNEENRSTVESRSLEAARARGLTPETLSHQQSAYWLTATERELPDPNERLLRLLVRSSHLTAVASRFAALPHAARLLDPGLDSAAAVRTAWRVNAAVAESAPHRSVHRLRPDILTAHVAELWQIPAADRQALDAAARDRGFPDAETAVEIVRAFYLHVSGMVDGHPAR
ncbi:TfuA-like protein [Streptomyces sp. NPDC050355]|uniref:TfuA-like protein n=1 Tax=Streptomyces sp. NPDC050355 TaxID=3365609 RepID=UPI0037BA0FF4